MTPKTTTSPGKAVYELILEAERHSRRDMRSDVRLPFFRPLSINTGDGHSYSAFSRDISSFGIGFIHNMELSPGEVHIRISSERGHTVSVPTQIRWCQSCGEGWYISGGEFVGSAVID
jgi:hypothetical protein